MTHTRSYPIFVVWREQSRFVRAAEKIRRRWCRSGK